MFINKLLSKFVNEVQSLILKVNKDNMLFTTKERRKNMCAIHHQRRKYILLEVMSILKNIN